MKINLKDAKALLLVQNGLAVKKSSFGKSFLQSIEQMRDLGALKEVKVSRNSFEISLGDKEAYTMYLNVYFKISHLENYVKALKINQPTRAELSNLGVSTKLKSVNPKSGLHINSPDGVLILINNEEVLLSFPRGCALFVHKDTAIEITEDILIVGVENFENISGVLQERDILPDRKIVFMERSRALQEFLKTVDNDFLYYGDIDRAGVFIFQTEYEPIVGGRSSFFIPPNIEKIIIEKGVSDLHETHKKKYKNLVGNSDETKAILRLIDTYGKTVEQEAFLQ